MRTDDSADKHGNAKNNTEFVIHYPIHEKDHGGDERGKNVDELRVRDRLHHRHAKECDIGCCEQCDVAATEETAVDTKQESRPITPKFHDS